MEKVKCSISECNKISEKRKMCGMHYRRFQRYGDVNFVTKDWKTGRKNPNCKYKNIKDDFFSQIDTKEKAYFLGWIASDGCVRKSGVKIALHYKDAAILEDLRSLVGGGKISRLKSKPNMVDLTINSQQIASDVASHLKIPVNVKKDRIVGWPDLNEELIWAYMRGYFEGDGNVGHKKNGYPRCSVASCSPFSLKGFKEVGLGTISGNNKSVTWEGPKALDFLGKLYKDETFLHLNRKKDLFLQVSLWNPALSFAHTVKNFKNDSLKLRYCKVKTTALPLIKHNLTDSGYDIAIIDKVKSIGNVCLYGTGIKVRPPDGFYFDLIPRSSIIKSGYMLANSIGVIDRTYVGEILVPLVKIDENAPELQLPIRLVQLVPRQIIHAQFIEVNDLEETSRGTGGFGSSGV